MHAVNNGSHHSQKHAFDLYEFDVHNIQTRLPNPDVSYSAFAIRFGHEPPHARALARLPESLDLRHRRFVVTPLEIHVARAAAAARTTCPRSHQRRDVRHKSIRATGFSMRPVGCLAASYGAASLRQQIQAIVALGRGSARAVAMAGQVL